MYSQSHVLCGAFVDTLISSPVYEYHHSISGNICSSDAQSELEAVKKIAVESGAYNAVICNHWALGGRGAADLANAVIEATNQPSKFQFLYPLEVSENLCWKTLSGL